MGLRHDGGDAETGFGVDVGGGLAWNVPKLGLTFDVSGRTLVAHQDGGFKDWGYSAGVLLEPGGGPGRGPSLNLRREFGSAAQGGVESLFTPEPMTGQAGGMGSGRWTMEAGWGFAMSGGRLLGGPSLGAGISGTGRDYRRRLALRAAARCGTVGKTAAQLHPRHSGHPPRNRRGRARARHRDRFPNPLLADRAKSARERPMLAGPGGLGLPCGHSRPGPAPARNRTVKSPPEARLSSPAHR